MRLLFFYFFAILLGYSSGLHSQNYSLKLDVPDSPGGRVYLASFHGDEQRIVDSTLVDHGSISFIMKENYTPGMYRLYFSDPEESRMRRREPVSIDFIFNREDIELMTSYNSVMDEMTVLRSEENLKYYDFVRLRSDYRTHLGLMLPLTEVYDSNDIFFTPLREELLNIQKEYNDSLVKLSDTDPEMLVSSLIALNKEPVYDPAKSEDLSLFMRENYLKPVSFTDERLINTNALTQKIISYLSFFRQPGMSKEQQEEAFIKAVDIIMAEVSYDQKIYDFVLNYLISGFEQFQMEEVLVHIADNHLAGECKTESEEIAKERLEAYQRMARGKEVPDINLLDPFDAPQRLSSLNNEKILLVFWSTECPHCTSLLPRLKKWYEEEKEDIDIGIYTVSIDKNRLDWEEFILENDLNRINVYDPEGWESKTSQRYNIYATPTMFLLDKDLRIIDKPVSFREFKQTVD